MYSESLLELGLTTIGWDFYSKIITFIVALNLHLLPFVFMFIRNWWETSRSQDAGYATVTELKRTTSDFLVMGIIVLLFWLPNSKTTFNAQQYVTESSAATYDKIQLNQTGEIPLPPGWWVLSMFTKSAVSQIITWMEFEPRVQTMLHAMNTMKINDPEIQFEVNAFLSSCYYPVLKRWQSEHKHPVPQPASDSISDSPRFIGNNLFLNTPGYYKQCHQTELDSGVCYGDARRMPEAVTLRNSIKSRHLSQSQEDSFYYTQAPSCYTWWTGNEDHYYDNSGIPSNYVPLRKALVNETKSHFMKYPNSMANRITPEEENQLMVQLLSNNASNLSGVERKSSDSFWDLLKNGVTYVIGLIGGTMLAWMLTIVVELLKPLLFMLQSLAIFAVIMSMSITLLLGGFRPGVVMKHGAFLFSIMLLPVFWHAADFLNESLLKVLYPQYESGVMAVILNEGFVAIIYFVFLILAYLAMPGYFVKLMGQAGADAADVAGDAMRNAKEASDKGTGATLRGIGGISGAFKKK